MKTFSFYYKQLILIAIIFCPAAGRAQTNNLIIAENGKTQYKIIIPHNPNKTEQQASVILQNYIYQVAGIKLNIINEADAADMPAIYIGNAIKSSSLPKSIFEEDSYSLMTVNGNLFFYGQGKGLLYSVYHFIEKYLGCRKYAHEKAIIPTTKTIKIPATIDEQSSPVFQYREAYYPAALDNEYLDWHALQRFEDLWGLWGHSFYKLVPPKKYFKEHPEYYSLINGKRAATQLCLSNGAVYKIVVEELEQRMKDNPDARYWSVSPNDDAGNCECDLCKAKDVADGGPQGSLISFVNRVAKNFPDKKITTLAYGYSSHPTTKTKPEKNVVVFLSSIDAYRDKPLSEEASAAAFRRDLTGWVRQTPNVFIWDYTTEFTNYLAPFPDEEILQPNIKYLQQQGAKGILEQGSGETISDFSELKTYLLAQLFWNPDVNVNDVINDFMNGYYGVAAKYIHQYYDKLIAARQNSKSKLDIYGNPINEWNSYLSPTLIDSSSELLDKAEAATEANPIQALHILRVRLSLEYTVLQQAKFYGVEKFGFYQHNENGYAVKPAFKERVQRFVKNCGKAGVKELSEGGLTPQQYLDDWTKILSQPLKENKALNTSVTIRFPFAPEYPSRGTRTLVDGNVGYNDFSYNWLCFYGVPMIATIDLGKNVTISEISMNFLDDPRHWIFLPSNVSVEISEDNKNFISAGTISYSSEDEHYEITRRDFTEKLPSKRQVRYIKITAENLQKLPDWRQGKNKKLMIACDEVFIN